MCILHFTIAKAMSGMEIVHGIINYIALEHLLHWQVGNCVKHGSGRRSPLARLGWKSWAVPMRLTLCWRSPGCQHWSDAADPVLTIIWLPALDQYWRRNPGQIFFSVLAPVLATRISPAPTAMQCLCSTVPVKKADWASMAKCNGDGDHADGH